MEQKVNAWKANLTNGLILGLIGVAYSLIMYFLDLTTKQSLGYLFIIIEIVVLYFLVKSYRDNYMHGMITYGQALGAGMIICVYYAIIAAIFGYILYAIIDPGLIDKMLALSEEQNLKRGMTQEQIDLSMRVTKKIMTPVFMTIMAVLGNIFFGLIISLIVAAFVRKEGNPLVDSSPNA